MVKYFQAGQISCIEYFRIIITESKMKKSILCVVSCMVASASDNNVIIGDDNTVNGNKNVQVGFNTVIDGSDNWTVGNKHIVIGSGIKMFGPDADPYFYKNAPLPVYKSTEGVTNFNTFFEKFDPFTYQPETSSQKRWYGSSNNRRW